MGGDKGAISLMHDTLNLWAWIDASAALRLGASKGPSGSIVDLTAWDPALHSMEAIWQRKKAERSAGGDGWQWLRDAIANLQLPRVESDRVSLRFPGELSELWAAGVTYEQSREARTRESKGGEDFYRKVYTAERPELFFKAPGPRIVGPDAVMGLRPDSHWMVPEPELAVILDPQGGIFGYTAGNDLSSRDIEGENPLYLPQAKIFHHSAALGPSIALAETVDPTQLDIELAVLRGGMLVFNDRTSTARLRRSVQELVGYLGTAWPLAPWTGLMTGTGIVPPDEFALRPGDEVRIAITGIGTLRNLVRRIDASWVDFPNSRS